MSKQKPPQDPSRREALKTALKTGAYVAPVIIAANIQNTVSAQVSGPTGTLTGTITNAQNGAPISGATVAVGTRTTTTNASGVYTLTLVPAGARTIATSAVGFTSRTDSVTVVASGSTAFNASLVPGSSLTTGVAIVLNWEEGPMDLDSHLVGPNNAGGRFHCYFLDSNPETFVALDVDATDGLGPETISIGQVSGAFVPGTYNCYVHHYSGAGTFASSGGVVTVFSSTGQIAQFRVANATGTSSLRYWAVCALDITAAGAVTVTPTQQFTSTPATRGVDDPLPPKA